MEASVITHQMSILPRQPGRTSLDAHRMGGVQRLRPDNFTPPSRTPWGGRWIVDTLKAGLSLAVDAGAPVGESWEVSTEPSFPSTFDEGGTLEAAVARDPGVWLGERVAHEFGGCPLLVKVVDAAAHLSVQVHPTEQNEHLADDESGKTEAWVVLAARPDARIYLGFRDGVTRQTVAEALANGRPLSDLMNEVAVRPDDVYLLRPGLAHALGAGATVLEPQRVRPHRRSVTYRFWDWDRTYDASGAVDPAGKPRPLHIDEALAATDWDGPRGAALVESCRRTPVRAAGVEDGVTRDRVLDEPELWMERWSGTGSATLPDVGTLLAVVCLDGAVELTNGPAHVNLARGQTAVVPAAEAGVSARLSGARLALCSVPPPPIR